MNREEVIPKNRAVWHADKAKTYLCPFCHQPIHSQLVWGVVVQDV